MFTEHLLQDFQCRPWGVCGYLSNALEACGIAIKVFTCIKIACNRVGNIFATVLTIIATK